MAILFYTSSLPGDRIHLPPFPYSDKAVHFAAYAILGALIGLRRRLQASAVGTELDADARPGRYARDPHDLGGMALGMVYGVSDEIHQIFVPDRMFDYSDMGADFLGVAAGVWAFRKMTGLREG